MFDTEKRRKYSSRTAEIERISVKIQRTIDDESQNIVYNLIDSLKCKTIFGDGKKSLCGFFGRYRSQILSKMKTIV